MSSEELKKYEFKFLTKDSYVTRKTIPLYMGVDQAQKCLASEGVMITPASFIKCIDIYLRIIGVCRPMDDNEFPPVCILTGVVNFKYPNNLDDPKRLEMHKNLFDLVNDCVDDDHKIPKSDLEHIKANIPIVIKEVCIFCNDIVNLLVDEYSDENTVSVCAAVFTNINTKDTDHKFSVEISYNSKLETTTLYFQSSALVPITDDTATGILYNSFPKEVQENMKVYMEDEAKKEDKEDESSN